MNARASSGSMCRAARLKMIPVRGKQAREPVFGLAQSSGRTGVNFRSTQHILTKIVDLNQAVLISNLIEAFNFSHMFAS